MLDRRLVGAAPVLGLIVGLAAGCSEAPYPLPDRTTPAVRDEEKRLAALLPDRLLWGPGSCQVRLLGAADSSSYAWANCDLTPTAEAPSGGVSMPVLVNGEQVRTPVDGAGHAESIRQMFPRRLADAILREPEKLHP